MSIQRKNAYFAAANTALGFKSFFDEIFAHGGIERRYVIKGGPGTGKSSFMRRAALAAQREGREVEYYYCSSDTDSLDGIVIDGSLAILDGTAPHTCDATLPGVRDGIIDLGQFWDENRLQKDADSIILLNGQKAHAYSRAYSFLAAAGKVSDAQKIAVGDCLLREKMQRAARKTVAKLAVPVGSGRWRIRQVSAFGSRGGVRLDTLQDISRRTLFIRDYYGAAPVFLSLVADIATEQGIDVDVSVDLLRPDKADEIYFPATGDRIALCDDSDMEREGAVNTKRFVDAARISEIRCAHRTAKKAQQRLVDLALDSLSDAGRAHAKIEQYYVAAMDFERQTRYCEQFIERVVLTRDKKCDII